MRAQKGFTLIELIVVIIILGVLAATAVPKFIDFGGDARKSALQGFKGALHGANSMSIAKFSLSGVDNASATPKTVNGIPVTDKGYVAPSQAALIAALSLSESSAGVAADWDIDATTTTGTALISPVGAATGCALSYTHNATTGQPEYTLTTTGC